MKIVMADSFFAPAVNVVYTPGLHPSTFDAWVATVGFVGQLYCDFSGYSTCAVGVALCLGFVIPDNFRFPLAAIGLADFWRRWHISLSTWLHDYLFQPLGGYSKGRSRAAVNLMVTMILCGLWHGGTANFLIFGALHGIYTVGELALRRTWLHRLPIWQTALGKGVLVIFTSLLLTFSVVFFRATTLDQALMTACALFGIGVESSRYYLNDADLFFVMIPLQGILMTHFWFRAGTVNDAVRRFPWWIWSTLIAIMLYAIVCIPGSGESAEYLYFQF
jgi:D-alanyl-lipoteichoic acid acyltransferase DltB (MBOAT superfamily)